MSSETRPEAASHCSRCGQDVKPVEKKGWQNFLAWVALLQLGAVIAAIVAVFDSFDPDGAGGGIGRLVLWPAAIHPAWLGIGAAVLAFFTAVALLGAAGNRAERNAVCPLCGLRLTDQASSPSA